MEKVNNSENWISRGVIEFDPEIYERYFKPYESDLNFIALILITIFLLLLVTSIVIWRRRKAEELRLTQYMNMDPSLEERDGVPPPPDGLTLGRAPKDEDESIEDDDIKAILATDDQTWLARLKTGLSKTRKQISDNLQSLFSGKTKINDEILEQMHETLYRADVGVKTADLLIEKVRKSFSSDQEVTWPNIKECLEQEVHNILAQNSKAIQFPASGPMVILVVGVNGVGKTTTCGKLAAYYLSQGKSVLMAAADTFRAAAIDQLKVWGDRLKVEVIAHQQGADPAAVAFDAVKAATSRKVDVLLVDTAGRLQNKKELMDELQKIHRVLGKEIPEAPHETWLVIDATTGQNAVSQVKAFSEVAKVSGVVATKLDGTAKGGILIGISHTFGMPIQFIGIGEKAEDLRGFKAEDYASSLF